MKKLTIVVCALVLLHWHGLAAGHAQNLLSVIRPSPHADCSPSPRLFEIDGITGEIQMSPDEDLFSPNDSIEIRIQRANLIHYKYEIVLKDEEEVVRVHNVVGLGPVAETNRQAMHLLMALSSVKPPQDTTLGTAPPDSARHVVGKLVALHKQYWSLQDSVTAVVDSLMKVNETQEWDEHNGCEWPAQYDVASNFLESRWPDFQRKFSSLNAGLNRLELEVDTIRIRAKAEKDVAATLLHTKIDTLRRQIQALAEALADVRSVAQRWLYVTKTNRQPVVSYILTTGPTSAEYTIRINRIPVSGFARNLTTDVAVRQASNSRIAPADTTILALLEVENRAKSRYNVTLGLAGIYLPQARSYSVARQAPAPDQDSEASPVFKITETERSTFAAKPVITLGIYPQMFDALSDRWEDARLMVLIGSEISTSPDRFLLGLGLDTPIGLVLQAGVTPYTRKRLAGGWQAGSLVPVDSSGAPILSTETVPLKSRSDLGFFFTIGLRPVIFQNLLDYIRP